MVLVSRRCFFTCGWSFWSWSCLVSDTISLDFSFLHVKQSILYSIPSRLQFAFDLNSFCSCLVSSPFAFICSILFLIRCLSRQFWQSFRAQYLLFWSGSVLHSKFRSFSPPFSRTLVFLVFVSLENSFSACCILSLSVEFCVWVTSIVVSICS